MKAGDLVYDDSLGLIGIIVDDDAEKNEEEEVCEVLFQPVFSGEVFAVMSEIKDLTIISET